MHFDVQYPFNLTKLFWSPLLLRKTFWSPPFWQLKTFLAPSILPSPPPHQSIYEHSLIVELNYGIVLILPLEMLKMSILLRICIKVIILNSDVVNLILMLPCFCVFNIVTILWRKWDSICLRVWCVGVHVVFEWGLLRCVRTRVVCRGVWVCKQK